MMTMIDASDLVQEGIARAGGVPDAETGRYRQVSQPVPTLEDAQELTAALRLAGDALGVMLEIGTAQGLMSYIVSCTPVDTDIAQRWFNSRAELAL